MAEKLPITPHGATEYPCRLPSHPIPAQFAELLHAIAAFTAAEKRLAVMAPDDPDFSHATRSAAVAQVAVARGLVAVFGKEPEGRSGLALLRAAWRVTPLLRSGRPGEWLHPHSQLPAFSKRVAACMSPVLCGEIAQFVMRARLQREEFADAADPSR